MRLTDWFSFLRPVPRPPVRRKSWRRSQGQSADAIKQRIALEEIVHLQARRVTGTFLAGGSEPVTVNFRPSGGGLASMNPMEDLPDNMGDERNSEGPTLGAVCPPGCTASRSSVEQGDRRCRGEPN